MFLSQALDRLHAFTPEQFNGLADVLSPELNAQSLEDTGSHPTSASLILGHDVWCLVGLALYRHIPMSRIVNQLDILLPGNRPFVAPSALVQARQRLGDEAIRQVFEQTQSLWHKALPQFVE